MEEGRDRWWHDLVANAPHGLPRRAAWIPKIRSTSSTPRGTTGKPKGLVHTTGGYAVQTYLTTK